MTAQPTTTVCPRCGGAMWPLQQPIMVKQRVKFGATWLLITLFTCGLGFFLWLVMPRVKRIVGYRPTPTCGQCGLVL